MWRNKSLSLGAAGGRIEERERRNANIPQQGADLSDLHSPKPRLPQDQAVGRLVSWDAQREAEKEKKDKEREDKWRAGASRGRDMEEMFNGGVMEEWEQDGCERGSKAAGIQ